MTRESPRLRRPGRIELAAAFAGVLYAVVALSTDQFTLASPAENEPGLVREAVMAWIVLGQWVLGTVAMALLFRYSVVSPVTFLGVALAVLPFIDGPGSPLGLYFGLWVLPLAALAGLGRFEYAVRADDGPGPLLDNRE